MWAFDLDGVFISDQFGWENDDELKMMLKVRTTNLRPIFQPNFPFYIITGRPKIDEEATLTWVRNNFNTPPLKVFHDNETHLGPVAYKIRVLQEESDIDFFVESCPKQVLELRKAKYNRLVNILHFEEFITMSLTLLYNCSKGAK
jgi:hypothetical protein